jgi:hypothetical protein
MSATSSDAYDGNRNLDRAVVFGRLGFVAFAVLVAITEDVPHPWMLAALPASAAVASWGMYTLPFDRSRGWWVRAAALCDLCGTVLAIFAGVSVVHLEEFAALNFAIILAAATFVGGQFRLYEVIGAAAGIVLAQAVSMVMFESVSLISIISVAVFNALLVFLWWARPLRLHRVHAVRLYVHDMHGFLHAVQWALELDSPEIREDIRAAVNDRIKANAALEQLLSTDVHNRRAVKVDIAAALTEHFPTITPPPGSITAPPTGFAAALAAIAVATDAAPPTWEVSGRWLVLQWPAPARGWTSANAVRVASHLTSRPHTLHCTTATLELRLRLRHPIGSHPVTRLVAAANVHRTTHQHTTA